VVFLLLVVSPRIIRASDSAGDFPEGLDSVDPNDLIEALDDTRALVGAAHDVITKVANNQQLTLDDYNNLATTAANFIPAKVAGVNVIAMGPFTQFVIDTASYMGNPNADTAGKIELDATEALGPVSGFVSAAAGFAGSSSVSIEAGIHDLASAIGQLMGSWGDSGGISITGGNNDGSTQTDPGNNSGLQPDVPDGGYPANPVELPITPSNPTPPPPPAWTPNYTMMNMCEEMGSEESPLVARSECAQAFQRDHLLAMIRGKVARQDTEEESRQPPSARVKRDPICSTVFWGLPKRLRGTYPRYAAPVIQRIKPETLMAAFEYARGDSEPLALVFAADSSATLSAYRGAVSTCIQTTFGFVVENVYSQDGLLVYQFSPREARGRVRYYGAQWLVAMKGKEATICSPVIPDSRHYPPGIRLISWQVLAKDRMAIREIYRYFRRALSARHETRLQWQKAPETWIQDATMNRDRLTASVFHRGLPSVAEVEVRMWPRTYDVAEGTRLVYHVSLERGVNFFSARLPWFPGAASVEVRDGASKSLSFLQREVVPLADTHVSETAGSTELREGLMPLLGYQRGIVATGKAPMIHLPFASFKQRPLDLRRTTGMAFDLDVDVATELTARVRTRLVGPLDQGPVAYMKLHAGRNTIELPWSSFDTVPASGFGVTVHLQACDKKSQMVEATIRQAAVVSDSQFGRYLGTGSVVIDFGAPPDLAVVHDHLVTYSSKPPAWLPPLTAEEEPAKRLAGQIRILAPGHEHPVRLMLSEKGVQDRLGVEATTIGACTFHPASGLIGGKPAISAGVIAFPLPERMLNRMAAFELGPPRSGRSQAWRTASLAAVCLGGVMFVGVVYWAGRRGFRVSRRGALLAASLLGVSAITAGFCYAFIPRSAPFNVSWPYEDGKLELVSQEEPNFAVMPTIGPAVVDPIGPSPDIKVRDSSSLPRSATAAEETIFADFNRGRVTVFGGTVGGFTSPGAECTAECVDAVRDGNVGKVLQIKSVVPPSSFSGVWFTNPPNGIDTSPYRIIRFDARSDGVGASWTLEFKRQKQIIGACRIVLPGGQWYPVDVPLADLARSQPGALAFDELVFKFTAPSSSVLLGNVRFVK
jgi:hypothetical protein